MATVSLQWLAGTKLQAPARRRDALPRPRLVQAVEQGLGSSRLTLVTAPAGSGKTTLLTEIPHTLRDRKFAWLLLDHEDNDPTLFAAALVASLQKLDARIAAGAWNSEDVGIPAWRRAATAILNDLARFTSDPTVVVLDDFHAITDRTVAEMIDYMVERSPEHVRWLIATRYRPELSLARWRARGDLAEFTLDHLSFTAAETTDLVQRSLGLSLSDHEIRLMCAKTQGWAAGIRLLASSVAQSPGVREKLQDANYSSRRIFDFLSEEVLEKQTPEIRRFLLETSILSSLQPAVCDALTGRADSQSILEDLYRRSLFVVAADDAESTFRYHDLFAQFLRSRLAAERPADLPELHRQAAMAETAPPQRIAHLLAAHDWDAAAAEILQAAPRYLDLDFSATVRRWIHELPPEVQKRHPHLQYALGRATWAQGEWSDAMPHLSLALEGFQAAGDQEGQGQAMVALAVAAFSHNDIARAGELMAGALNLPIPPASRVQLLCSRSWLRMIQQDWTGAEQDISQMMELLATPEGFSQRNSMAVQLAMFQTGLAGGPDRMEKLCASLLTWLLSAPSVNLAYYHTLRSALLLCRGAIPESDDACAEALRISAECGGVAFVEMGARVGQCLCSVAGSDWAKSLERTQRTRDELALSDMGRGWLGLPLYMLGRTQWLSGDIEGLRRTYDQIAEPTPMEMPALRVFRPMLRAMLQMAVRAPVQAEAALLEAVEQEDAVRVTRALSSAQALKAHFHRIRGQALEAVEALRPFLAGCERDGAPGRVLLEGPLAPPLLRLAIERNAHRPFAERMLARLGETPEAAPELSSEQLSERELDVLRLMAQGLGNRDIAAKLFVSEATVKTHVQRILRKLDASSRTQAVARARQMMLVD